MKKISTLLLLLVFTLTMLATSVAFANRGRQHQQPPQQRYQQRYHHQPQRHQQHWHHHRGPSTGYLVGAVIADAIIVATQQDNSPCEQQEVYQPPCEESGPVPIATGFIPLGSGQYVQVSPGQYADIEFRNGTRQTFVGPRRIYDAYWYALFNQ